jgi:TRAP-type C4-dicarboxylate transport system permease small subunit
MRGAQTVLGLALLGVVAVNVANAAARYLAGVSLTGTDEAMIYTMVWIVMAGAALSVASRSHIAIDLVPGAASRRGRLVLNLLHNAVILAACGYAALASWQYTGRIAALGTTSMGLGIPMIWAHAALLAGFGAMAAIAAGLMLRDLGALLRPARAGQGRAA